MWRCIFRLDFPAQIGAISSSVDRQVEAAFSSAMARR
jgi:hypothetical protein